MNKLRPFFYGIAELGPASIDIFLKVYLLIYFNQVMGLSASLTSLAIGLSVLWDAVADPIIGIISDRHYEKYLNRQRILYCALFAICILFFLLWHMHSSIQWLNLLLLFFISSFLNSAISLFSVPYFAVANDFEPSNEKRRIWIGWRLAFFNLGSFVGLVVPAYFLTQESDPSKQAPYFTSVSILTMLTFALTFFSVFMTHFKYSSFVQKVQTNHEQHSFKDLLKDKNFLQIILAFFVVNCGLGLNSSLALYYYKTYLELSEKQTQTVLVVFLAIFTASIPLWVMLTRFFDKKKLIIAGAALLGVLTVLTFPHYKGIEFWIIVTVACGVGGVLVGVAVVLEIFLSDFLKQKEDHLQRSVSGQYLGLWKMSSKVSRAVAIALAGPIIEVSTGHPQILANYFGWGVGLFFILSALVMAVPVRKENQ